MMHPAPRLPNALEARLLSVILNGVKNLCCNGEILTCPGGRCQGRRTDRSSE